MCVCGGVRGAGLFAAAAAAAAIKRKRKKGSLPPSPHHAHALSHAPDRLARVSEGDATLTHRRKKIRPPRLPPSLTSDDGVGDGAGGGAAGRVGDRVRGWGGGTGGGDGCPADGDEGGHVPLSQRVRAVKRMRTLASAAPRFFLSSFQPGHTIYMTNTLKYPAASHPEIPPRQRPHLAIKGRARNAPHHRRRRPYPTTPPLSNNNPRPHDDQGTERVQAGLHHALVHVPQKAADRVVRAAVVEQQHAGARGGGVRGDLSKE